MKKKIPTMFACDDEKRERERQAESDAPVASVCPGDYLDGREDEADLDLPRLRRHP
jgi:hypothetical protein